MKITSGRVSKPFNVMLVGTPGIGKSSWAASLPSPIFCPAEELDEIDCDRLPQAESFKDAVDQLKFLIDSDNKYRTVVIDTIDAVERLLHREILDSDPRGATAMAQAHGGYSKAYEMSLTKMDHYRGLLKKLRDEKKMNICILCHTKTKRTADAVIGSEYDEYKTSLHEKVEGLFVDWVSAVLFANYVTFLKDGSGGKDFAVGDGERVILTEKRPGHIGKNRYGLPYELDMPIENPSGPFLSRLKEFYKTQNAGGKDD